jgi:hypothetical protein
MLAESSERIVDFVKKSRQAAPRLDPNQISAVL